LFVGIYPPDNRAVCRPCLMIDREDWNEADFALPHTKVRALLGLAGRYEYNHHAD
jgi:hypothetical protein